MLTLFVENRRYKYAMWILIIVILAMSFFHLTRVVRDNDFFWHLKSGQWLWENRAFPESDPFSYTTSMLEGGRVRFIFTSFWLSQLFFYLFFLAGGMPGIVMARFLIAGLLFFVMFRLHRGDKLLYLSLLAMALALVFRSYPLERPQVFSFIFFGAVLFMLERIKDDPEDRAVLFGLPLSMLVWANLHGGYALGIMIIILYLVMEGLKFLHPSLRPLGGNAYKRLVLAGLAAIAISFLNPGTFYVFSKGVLFQAESAISDNLEFQSTVWIFRKYADFSILIYWFILVCAVSALVIDRRRADITKVALMACVGYFSFTTLRYVAFLLIAAIPIIGESFSRTIFIKVTRAAVYSAALAIAIFFTVPHLGLETLRSGEWVDTRKFPVGAADFIAQHDLKGNMYNFFNWGGYLIWRLAPERKVFIDGRTLDSGLYEQASIIDKAVVDPQSGMTVWKYFLDERHVDYVVIPCSRDSRSFPLCEALKRDREWVQVFSDQTSVIFVRNAGLNS